jgi:hypothetical protein
MISKGKRSELGRLLASLRAKVRVKCAYCGAPTTGTKKREYCSARCRMAACRERKRGQQEQQGSS